MRQEFRAQVGGRVWLQIGWLVGQCALSSCG